MRFAGLIFAVLFTISSATSCNWIREKMGMETTEDIVAKKVALEREKIEANVRDSLEQVYRDSVICAQAEKPVVDANNMIDKGDNYHLVVGSFRHYDNAEKLVARLKKDGYAEAFWFDLANGFRSVSAASYPTRAEAYREMYKLFDTGRYWGVIEDIWIYKR